MAETVSSHKGGNCLAVDDWHESPFPKVSPILDSSTMVMMANNTNRKNNNSPLRVGLYDIGHMIGEGNFATVRFAKHRHTKSEVGVICVSLLASS